MILGAKRKFPAAVVIDLEKLGLRPEHLAPWKLEIKDIYRLSNNRWRLLSNRGEKILARVSWPPERLQLLCAFMDHLGRQGYRKIPRFIRTADGRRWVEAGESAFYLYDHYSGITPDFSSSLQVELVFRALSLYHRQAAGFSPPAGSQFADYRGSWPAHWENAREKLVDLCQQAEKDKGGGIFTLVFLQVAPLLISRIDTSLCLLNASEYFTLNEQEEAVTLCHRDFREENLVLTLQQDVFINGFDGCGLDLRIYDLGRLLHRLMIRSRWSLNRTQEALNAYEEVNPLGLVERQVLVAMLVFPFPALSYIGAYNSGREVEKRIATALKQELAFQGPREKLFLWLYRWAQGAA